ncbi:MAG: cytochrome P450, partial [Actinomycetota bacterium]
MTGNTGVQDVPQINLTDPAVLSDPFAAYGQVRETAAVAQIVATGMGPMWVLLRYREARAMLADPRFELNPASYMRPDVPESCLAYMRTMSEIEGPEHARLRRLVSPPFTTRRAAGFRPRIQPLVDRLLDELPGQVEAGSVDLLEHLARPLPIDVICELVGIPEHDRGRWRGYGVAVASGWGDSFTEAIPAIMEGAKEAIALRTAEPQDDLLSELIRTHAEDGDRLDADEVVTLVWHLVLGGQTPANLIVNGMQALFAHPDQLKALRREPALITRAVEELLRWCGPQLLTIPRYAREDVEIAGTRIGKGDAVTAALASVNRDPRVLDDPERFDIARPVGTAGHLAFGHGPHFCLGAALARVETEVVLTALLSRFPHLRPAVPLEDLRH